MYRYLLASLISIFVLRSYASKSKLHKSTLQVLPSRFHESDNVSVHRPMRPDANFEAVATEVGQYSDFESYFTKEMVSDKPTKENYKFQGQEFPSRIYEFKYQGQVISMVHAIMLLAGQQELSVRVMDRDSKENPMSYNLVTDLGVNEVELAAACEAFRQLWRSAFVEAGKELAGVLDSGLDYNTHFVKGEAVNALTPYFDIRASVLQEAFQIAFIQWKTDKQNPSGEQGCPGESWPGSFSPFFLDRKLHQLQTIPYVGEGKLMLIQSLGRSVAPPKSFESPEDREAFGKENCNPAKLGPKLPANYCNRAAMHLMVAGNDDTVSQTLSDVGVAALGMLTGSTMVTYKCEGTAPPHAVTSNMGQVPSRKFHLVTLGLGENADAGAIWLHWRFQTLGARNGDTFQIVPEWMASGKNETLTHRVPST